MRMSIPGGIAACAVLAALPLLSVALLSTPAFAAKGNVSPQRAGTAVVVKPSGPIPAAKPYRP